MQNIQSIQNRIYEIRGEHVMLDKDLRALYETETKDLNLAVKRNLKRFPRDFMFQLTKDEFEALRFQIEALENSSLLIHWHKTGQTILPAIIVTGKGSELSNHKALKGNARQFITQKMGLIPVDFTDQYGNEEHKKLLEYLL